MWVLEAQSLGSSDERSVRVQTTKHYLTAGSHVVGRNITAGQSSVVVEEDKSISRGHAVISVAYGEQACFKVKGFVHQPVESASCIVLPDRAPMTADLVCTLTAQKPYVTCKWLQAILERPSLSDPPAQMAEFKPIVYTAGIPQGLQLPSMCNQHLLSGFAFVVPPEMAQATPKLEAAVHLHGGTIGQQNTGSRCCVLVATDVQKADLSSVPPNMANLHITTVDHMLGAMLRSDTTDMTRPVNKEELPKVEGAVPTQRCAQNSNKRKLSPGLAAPAHKKQHTEHVQIASTNPVTLSAQDKQSGVPGTAAEMSVQCPAPVQASQDATSHAAQASDPQPREAAAAPNTASNPADEAQGLVAHPSASAQQAACSEGQMPDNNTILWEPLVVKVQRPVPAQVDDQTMTPNFKRFRKLQPSLAAHNTVAFCPKGYAESNIDSEAFLNQQKSRQQQQRVAEELFNAHVRVQKQPAVSKAGRGRGRGR